MHLGDFLKREGKSQADFGTSLNPPVSQALISQWLRGVTRITLSYALDIERMTRGQVTPQDCADMVRMPDQNAMSP